MLIIQDLRTGKPVEFGNSSALKEFLKMQNPTFLAKYIKEIEATRNDIKITGSGDSIRIKIVGKQ